MPSSGWFCGIVRRKEVNFVVLLVQLRFVGFSMISRVSRLSKVRVGIRVSVGIWVSSDLVIGWDMTSRVSGVTCRVSDVQPQLIVTETPTADGSPVTMCTSRRAVALQAPLGCTET